MAIVRCKDKEVVELLVANGVDVNTKNEEGDTPLHIALRYDRINLAELLIAKGADVRTQTQDGDTLLHQVASKGYKKLIELLIAFSRVSP